MNRPKLVATLELVGEALSGARPLVPIFECFCFKSGQVHAYNGELAIVAPCDVNASFAANGRTLLGLLQHGSIDEIELKLDRQELLGVCGKSTIRLPYFPKEDFVFTEPADFMKDDALYVSIRKGIETCLPTASVDQTQAAIMGVTFGPEYAYSCNGDTVTKYRYNVHESNQDKRHNLIPTNFCKAFLKTAASDNETLIITDNWVITSCGNIEIYANRPSIPTPFDYEGKIKATLNGKPVFVPNTTELKWALRRAQVVAEPVSGKTTLTVKDNTLALYTETPMGIVHDIVPFEHPDVLANVSSTLLLRSMDLCNEMAILPNCTAHQINGEETLQLVGNMR
jgi:DNA polymerase III sliding clamp (beta) subunit (PCNA family)